jgi:hypothetical protein
LKKLTRKPTKIKSAGGSGSRAAAPYPWSPNRRRVVVLLSLVAVLTMTSLLLRWMARSPMQPDAADTLFAYSPSDSIDSIFRMQAAVQPGRWQYIYLHHSKTAGGNALAMGSGPEGVCDHFIIGNGEGLIDGELQISQLWNHQQSAPSPSGNLRVQPNCIAICLVGDFDRNPPTPMQLGRLGQLVQALQGRCRIPANRIEWLNDGSGSTGGTPAGIGRFFPAAAFHDQLRAGAAISQVD